MDDENVISPALESAPGEAAEGSAPSEEPEQVESVVETEEAPKSNDDWARHRIEKKEALRRAEEAEAKLAAYESQINSQPAPSTLETLRATQFQPTSQEPTQEPVLNWNQWGYVDQNQILQTAEAKTAALVEEKLDEDRARRDYPDIFKDPETEKRIAHAWWMSKTTGQPFSFQAEAKALADLFGKVGKQQVQQAVKDTLSQVTEKEAASLDAIAQTSGPARQEQMRTNLEELRNRSRKGDVNALAERLKNL